MAPPKKRRDAEKELKKKGFTLQPKRGKGSHEVWKDKNGISVTVPKHGDEIAPGTWRSIEEKVNEAPRNAASNDAQNAQRLSGSGVAKPGGKRQGSGQGQRQGQQGGQQQSGKKRRFFGGRGS